MRRAKEKETDRQKKWKQKTRKDVIVANTC